MGETILFDHIDDHLLYFLPQDETAKSYFASPERDSTEEIKRQLSIIDGIPMLHEALDAMPDMVMILNDKRQIIAANKALLDVLCTDLSKIVPLRPGEALGCIRSKDMPGGCGTSLHCVTCGAVDAIVQCVKTGKKTVRECRIQVAADVGTTPLDLKVNANPFDVEENHFLMIVAQDISHEKRLAVLQRTFFHDVLNAAGCIQGYVDYLASDTSADQDVCQRLSYLSNQIIDDIQSHRDLLHAESGDLQIQPSIINTSQILDELRAQYLRHPVALDRLIEIHDTWDDTIVTDRRLLMRILGNMLKNALEATSEGGKVTLKCSGQGNSVLFAVHNAQVMTQDVQLQIFQRSFSTKGLSGRGIGTYCMKLFGERYLKGKVDFVSQFPEGTTFRLQISK